MVGSSIEYDPAISPEIPVVLIMGSVLGQLCFEDLRSGKKVNGEEEKYIGIIKPSAVLLKKRALKTSPILNLSLKTPILTKN